MFSSFPAEHWLFWLSSCFFFLLPITWRNFRIYFLTPHVGELSYLVTLLCCKSSFFFFLFLLPLSVLTFWLCKRSLLCSPVSCLIIEDSVCLLGAPPYPLIKACVCVCLFISCYYSRYSPGALKRHKSGVPVEANTVSRRCSFTHVTKNEFLSLEKKKKKLIWLSFHILELLCQ